MATDRQLYLNDRDLTFLEELAKNRKVSIFRLLSRIVHDFIILEKHGGVIVSPAFMKKVLNYLSNDEICEVGSWLGQESAGINRVTDGI